MALSLSSVACVGGGAPRLVWSDRHPAGVDIAQTFDQGVTRLVDDIGESVPELARSPVRGLDTSEKQEGYVRNSSSNRSLRHDGSAKGDKIIMPKIAGASVTSAVDSIAKHVPSSVRKMVPQAAKHRVPRGSPTPTRS